MGHPFPGPVHEDIGAVAAGLFEAASVPEDRIVVLIVGGIAATPREGLPDATRFPFPFARCVSTANSLIPGLVQPRVSLLASLRFAAIHPLLLGDGLIT
jgi:hypothetical protein